MTETDVRARNWALALMFVTGALNVFDRQIVNILAQDIKTELGLSDASLGLLTGTAFGLFYSLLGIPIGRLADKVDRVKLMSAVLVIWSGFTAACALAQSFTQLFLFRMGVGVGEAGSQPTSTALIADYFPPARRTSAMSVLLAGAPVGGFLGLSIGGYVATHWGWRSAFAVAGAPGVLVAIIMVLTMRDPVPAQARRGADESIPAVLRRLAAAPRFVWFGITLTCASFFPYASGAWLPPFFIRVYGLTTAQIGGYAAFAVGVGGAIGTLGSGILCDALRPKVANIEIKVLIAAFVLNAAALLVTVFAHSLAVAVTAMVLFNVSAWAFLGPNITLLQAETTPRTRAVSIALWVMISNIVNLGLGLFLIGVLGDAMAKSAGPRAIGYALATGAVIVAAIGIAAHLRASRVPAAVAIRE